MGVHTGEAELRGGDYYGTALNRAARLMSVAHGEQILVSLSTESLVADALPGDLALIDLGEQRLRDLSRPERVFQVVAPDLPTEFAAIRIARRATPATSRSRSRRSSVADDELVELRKALHEARLVTITGAGGVGKTRVAVQLAAELLQRFPDGAWLFELATGHRRPGDGGARRVDPVGGAALGRSPWRARSSSSCASKQALARARQLRAPARCRARLAAAVLRRVPAARVLATSREALGHRGRAGRGGCGRCRSRTPTASPAAVAGERRRCGSSSSARVSARPGFAVDARTRPRSRRSAGGSTGSRSRSSSPPPACVAMTSDRDRRPARRALPAADRRSPRRGGTPPDAARCGGVVVRVAGTGRALGVRPARSLRGHVRRGRRRGGDRRG